jgi:cation diffusion facilitator CzcD-associated flavoprotein CzcO
MRFAGTIHDLRYYRAVYQTLSGRCCSEMTHQNHPEKYDVIIIGAGFSGIGMGIKLKEAGIDNFLILEGADSIGGTWRDNDYPGCACDIPSHLYSFSFEPSPDWSRMFPAQDEIWAYLKHCVDKYGLTPYLSLNSNVDKAVFDEDALDWKVTTDDGRSFAGRALVSGMGGLSRPEYPDIPGLSLFKGSCFHSARWDHSFNFHDKTVAVIGTGASAIQFVPQIVDDVKSLLLFQRTPPWIVPKLDRPIRSWERWLYRYVPFARFLFRNFIYWRQEARGIGFTIDPRLMGRANKIALEHLEKQVADVQLRNDLTPDYTIGCKRILISSDYYPALQRDNLSLIMTGIREITADSIVDDEGHEHKIDAIILGTGFRATDPISPTRIFGIGDRELSQDWQNGPEAFLGINVAGYPNFFLLVGPNTGLGHNSMIFMIESQIRYTIKMLRKMSEEGIQAVDVKADSQEQFNRNLQQILAKSVWQSGCKSWYQTEDGKNSSIWPGPTFSYWARTLRPDMRHYNVTGRRNR